MAAKERENMNFTAFQNQIAKQVQEKLGKQAKVEVSRVIKNNGVVWNGIRITDAESNIAPTLYLDEFYQEYCDGRTLNSIVIQLLRAFEKSRIRQLVPMDFFLHFEQVRGKIVYRLVNYRKNEERLKTMPHIRFLDMAVIFVCTIMNDSLSSASILISGEHCQMWQVGTDELLEAAVENTPRYHKVCIKCMTEVIEDIFEEQLKEEMERFCNTNKSGFSREQAKEWAVDMQTALKEQIRGEQGENDMYVMGSMNKQYGAGTILYPGALMEFAGQKRTNFFILPCSVHEVILVPDTGRERADELQQMVKEVNRTELEAEEILSDSVYYFDRNTGKITLLREG